MLRRATSQRGILSHLKKRSSSLKYSSLIHSSYNFRTFHKSTKELKWNIEEWVLNPTGHQVCMVTINSNKANAINNKFMEDMKHCLDNLEMRFNDQSKEKPHGIILSNRGDNISAGWDLKNLYKYNRSEMKELLDKFNCNFSRLYQFPCTIVTALNGHALGNGMMFPLASDWVVATKSSEFGFVDTTLGFSFPSSSNLIIKGALSVRPRLKSLLLSGDIHTADEAKEYHILDHIVENDTDVIQAACEYISTIPHSQKAITALRSMLHTSYIKAFKENKEKEDNDFLDCWFDAETQTQLQQLVNDIETPEPTSIYD